jgi:hypothetical protein
VVVAAQAIVAAYGGCGRVLFYSNNAKAEIQSDEVLKIPIFGTCTLGFLPTQPPTHLIPE